jgi:hypothetical protein
MRFDSFPASKPYSLPAFYFELSAMSYELLKVPALKPFKKFLPSATRGQPHQTGAYEQYGSRFRNCRTIWQACFFHI